MELFDYLKAITEKKDPELDFNNDEIRKEYQPYLINRFVSMCEIYIPLVNEINKYDIPKEINYKYYHSVLPKRKQYFSYIKKSKDLNKDEKIIIAKYFQIGLKEAEEYISLMSENEINEILNMFRYGKNSLAVI